MQHITDLPSVKQHPNFYHPFPDPQVSFLRGNYRRIITSSLDLPPSKPPPNPAHASLWLNRLPTHVKDMLTTNLRQSFVAPLHRHISTAQKCRLSLPRPKVHCSASEYISLLNAADQAGMLYWSILPPKFTTLDHRDDALQLTLFAMSKTATRSRLISWPRIPNTVIPDPPHTSLPDPSLFDAITTTHAKLSGFYLDIHNMFHNITLTPELSKLFPFRPIAINQLPPPLHHKLLQRLPIANLSPHGMLRPYQATMPMGFKWSVYIAHTFATSGLQQAFALFKASSFAPKLLDDQLNFQRELAPFHLTPTSPLPMHIIDDIVAVAADWSPSSIIHWHTYIRKVFHLNRLPVSVKKPCPINHVENTSLNFVGCIWNLLHNSITPDPAKLAAVGAHIKHLLPLHSIPMDTWECILGKLIWFALLNRALLACTQRVFRLKRTEAQLSTRQQPVDPATKRELLMLTTLLPFAFVAPSLPYFHTLIAFDASLQAGAVTYTIISSQLAQHLWSQAKHKQFLPHTLDQTEEDCKDADYNHITSLNWVKAFSHSWRHQDHINDLEASTAVLALEWAIRSGAHRNRVTLITDSMVVRGCLQKGRPSSPPLLLRSRRFAALALLHNIRTAMLYIPSKLNPADRNTRFNTSQSTTSHKRTADRH